MFVGVGASRVRDLFTKAKAAAPCHHLRRRDRRRRPPARRRAGRRQRRARADPQPAAGGDGRLRRRAPASSSSPPPTGPTCSTRPCCGPGRFDRQVTVGLPDRAGPRGDSAHPHPRRCRWRRTWTWTLLARRTPGFSGADLANLANEAALPPPGAAADQVPMRDFDEAMDKIVLGTRAASLLMSEEERRVVAYHEAGHALVARLTPGADPVSKVTIIPHGRALGVTEQLPEEDRHNYSRDYLLGRLAVMMGGRAAEELVFGQPTTGAENDLKQATSLARRMVGLWGMSEELGPVSYGVGETHPFLGREMAQPREYAESDGGGARPGGAQDAGARLRHAPRSGGALPPRARPVGRGADRPRDRGRAPFGRDPRRQRQPQRESPNKPPRHIYFSSSSRGGRGRGPQAAALYFCLSRATTLTAPPHAYAAKARATRPKGARRYRCSTCRAWPLGPRWGLRRKVARCFSARATRWRLLELALALLLVLCYAYMSGVRRQA